MPARTVTDARLRRVLLHLSLQWCVVFSDVDCTGRLASFNINGSLVAIVVAGGQTASAAGAVQADEEGRRYDNIIGHWSGPPRGLDHPVLDEGPASHCPRGPRPSLSLGAYLVRGPLVRGRGSRSRFASCPYQNAVEP